MAPKRKRGDAAASPKKKKPRSLVTLVQELLSLSKNPKRCSEALQSLIDNDIAADGYWILLATHVIHRLTVLQKDACVLAITCRYLSLILLSDRVKLEKCAHAAANSKVARSVAGRAICAVTIGSTTALTGIVESKNDDSPLRRHALWACLQSLEAVVHLSNSTPPKSHSGDESWTAAAQGRLVQDEPHEQDIADACAAISTAVFKQAEDACLAALAPKKATKKGAALLVQRFQELEQLHEANAIVMEGRVSIRRWASMAFVWLCRGQEVLLEGVIQMLSNVEHWADVLDCPAAQAPTPKVTSSPGRGKKRTTAAAAAAAPTMVQVPGNVALVALVSRFLDVLSESGNACGVRAPTCGLDAYAATLLPSSKRSKPAAKKHAWERPDIRDAATVASYWLIQAHTTCVQEHCKEEQLVGDQDSRSVVTTAENVKMARFYPFCNKALDSLCRAAASSVVKSASVDVSDSVRRLLGFASACCLVGGTNQVVDSKLISFGIVNLQECLRNSLNAEEDAASSSRSSSQAAAGGGGDSEDLTKQFHLDVDLPVPTMPAKTRAGGRKKKGATHNDACTFGGVFSESSRGAKDQRSVSPDELLSLYLRAVASDGPAAENLFSRLLGIVRCCYDTPLEETVSEPPKEAPKKRGKRKKSPATKSKRRKVGTSKEDATAQAVADTEESASTPMKKDINSTRSALAADVLNVIRMCFQPQPHASARSPLRISLRGSFKCHHMCDFVQLGVMLDQTLVRTRIQTRSDGTKKGPFVFGGSSGGGFTHAERILWTAHTNLCIVLGRETTSYDSQRREATNGPILGDSSTRLAVFRAVAAIDDSASGGKEGRDSWPLFLPAIHHALVSSNLASEPLKDGDDASPERFIVNAYLTSIEMALQDLTIIAEWTFPYGNGRALPSGCVPLSLRDSMLFVTALCRLPVKEQETCLSNLVNMLFACLSSLDSNEPHRTLLCSTSAVSRFLARLITVSVTVVHTVYVAPSLRDSLFRHVGQSHYSLPTISTRNDVGGTLHPNDDWYTSEQCFMGLFLYWESPLIPEVSLPDRAKPLDGDLKKKLTLIFRASLELGMSSAPNDKCHLLFAAWNASGKASAWDTAKLTIKKTRSDSVSGVAPELLIELRDDMCRANREIHGDDSATSHSLLSSVLRKRDKGKKASTFQIKHTLKTMMDKADALVEALVSEELDSLSLGGFALFEALSVYVAFIVSQYTTAGNDSFFQSTQGRKPLKRSNARDMDSYDDKCDSENDSESDEDARMDGINRLHEASLAFGAAPLHPDWLDTSCEIRSGMNASETVAVAERAITCYNKLAQYAHTRYVQCWFEGIKSSVKHGPDADRRSALALQLCFMIRKKPEELVLKLFPDYVNVISRICKVDKEVLKGVLGVPSRDSKAFALGAWCPNSVQRINGMFGTRTITFDDWEPTLGELRAAGEWELLLSVALLGSSLELKSENLLHNPSNKETNDFMLGAERWRRVYETTVSNAMPAAALLRFGLSGAVGRGRHALNQLETDDDGVVDYIKPLRFVEDLKVASSVADSTKASVWRFLSLLPAMSSTSLRSNDCTLTCYAVAANLSIDSELMMDLEHMQFLRTAVSSMIVIGDMLTAKKMAQQDVTASNIILEGLIQAIEANRVEDVFDEKSGALLLSSSPTGGEESLKVEDGYLKTAGFLGYPTGLLLKCIVGSVECTGTFLKTPLPLECKLLVLEWRSEATRRRAITEMVSLLFHDQAKLNSDANACLARTLSGLSCLGITELADSMASVFERLDDARLSIVLLEDICLIPSKSTTASESKANIEKSKMISHMLCFIFARPGDRCRNITQRVFSILLDGIDKLCCGDQPVNHVLDLLFLLGTRIGRLKDVGSKLVSDPPDIHSTSGPDLHSLERFFRFVVEVVEALQRMPEDGVVLVDPGTKGTSNAKTFSKTTQTGSGALVCSYVRDKGFQDQHWYNCYTCGLVWDRGCCSVCARVCHNGHDVGYSRHSNFYCDCPSEDEGDRISCKCMTPVSSDALGPSAPSERNIYELASPEIKMENPKPSSSSESRTIEPRWLELICQSFRSEAESSIADLKEASIESSWIKSLFGLILHQYNACAFETSGPPVGRNANLASGARSSEDIFESLRRSIAARRGQALELQSLEATAMLPLRAAKSNSLKMALSADSTTNQLKRSMLSRNQIKRRAIAADSRGRLIIAEPCSLLFCSGLPAVNVRHIKEPCNAPFERRAELCILGSSPLKFNIVGMQLCGENERHLAVWGTAEACIVVLNSMCNRVEKTYELIFDLEPEECESDYLLKCEWLPGSQTLLAVACGPFVKIFSVQRAENDARLLPVICYNLAFEAMIRDIALVPVHRTSEEASDAMELRKETFVKLFLLLDSGRTHVVDVKADSRGDLEDEGERYLDYEDSVSIPVAGVGLTTPSDAPSAVRSLGEGSTCGLVYLSQSGLLLYSCLSSCVLALVFDSDGRISGSFEMLPNVVSSEMLGTGAGGFAIKGPFAHWTELGVVMEDGDMYFRVACVGQSSTTGQPKVLCIQYNERTSKVKHLSWPSGVSMGLGLSLSECFEGVAAFTAPLISSDACDLTKFCGDTPWCERAFLVAVTSNGAMLIFAEGVARDSNQPSSAPLSQDAKPCFPLTVFEKLINASDWDELSFSTDGVGSDSRGVKSKLSTKSSAFFMAPSQEGCTITISLPRRLRNHEAECSFGQHIPRETHESEVVDQERYAIVALRVLVGSKRSDFIPRKLMVEGRIVELKAESKRWYDLPLSHEEVALSIRNGFVSLGIGRSSESGNSPIVDAVEVYVTERKYIDSWLPKGLESENEKVVQQTKENLGIEMKQPDAQRALVLSIAAATNACNFLEKDDSDIVACKKTLSRIIHATATTSKENRDVWDGVVGLFEAVEDDPGRRQVFLDENIIFGLSRALNRAQVAFESKLSTDEHVGSSDSEARSPLADAWSQVETVLTDCCTIGTRIATQHPQIYLRSILKIFTDDPSSLSLAINAWKLVESGRNSFVDCRVVVPCLVKLILAEMSVPWKSGGDSTEGFADFEILSRLLQDDDLTVVESACTSMLSFLREARTDDEALHRRNSPTPVDRDESSAPIAYKCDSCSLFPITDKRFTLLEGGHDIDLCAQCFQIGDQISSLHGYDSGTEVLIRGRTLRLGTGSSLTCAQIKQMQPVSIAGNIQEQVEQARQAIGGISNSQTGLLPMDEQVEVDAQLSRRGTFNDMIFTKILNVVFPSNSKEAVTKSVPIFQMVLGVIVSSDLDEIKLERGKRFAKKLAAKVSELLRSCGGGETHGKASGQTIMDLVVCLRCLICLVRQKNDLSSISDKIAFPDNLAPCESHVGVPERSKEKTDPRFVCEAHGVPAVRRRCSSGVNKNRRFYVCGLERKSRCNYFKWADLDDAGLDDASDPNMLYVAEMPQFIWKLLTAPLLPGSVPLHAQLCDFLAREFSSFEVSREPQVCRPSEVKSTGDAKVGGIARLDSEYDSEAAYNDLKDGVFCSKEKLSYSNSPAFSRRRKPGQGPHDHTHSSEPVELPKGEGSSIDAVLELFSLVAEDSTQVVPNDESILNWFSLLCQIISPGSSSPFRLLAKNALKRFCGMRRAVYQNVRDHYVFGFEYDNLIKCSLGCLEEAIVRKEQARRCGTSWKKAERVAWTNLRAGGLIGTQDLLSEGCVAVESSKKISAVLDELLEVARSRCKNWRQFLSVVSAGGQKSSVKSTEDETSQEVNVTASCPPMVSLLWVACSLTGSNQIKAFTLLENALNPPDDWIDDAFQDGGEGLSSDGGLESEVATVGIAQTNPFYNGDTNAKPEDAILGGQRGLNVEEIHALVVQFVLKGRTHELRKVVSQVAERLCENLSPEDSTSLLDKMVDTPLGEISAIGESSVEFLDFVQTLVRRCKGSQALQRAANKIIRSFTLQMQTLYQDSSGGVGEDFVVLETKTADGESSETRFNLACCSYCHRQSLSDSLPKESQDADHCEHGTSRDQPIETPWLPDQVKPFVRGSLESSTDATVSTDFSNFVQLKYRLAVSNIHLTVTDPRARYVKTIAVYFTPRQVVDVNTLKSEEYSSMWQRCATLTLSRGASRFSCTLPEPVVAANLKFEYLEFHDRPGSTSRSSDGSLVLHCPRCTRLVTNAHGVCGNCGEVAFQCRKCRHINYDRLDAFLCVECGYCSCGGFDYELTAGIASNAVAVVDEDSYARATKILRVATKLHGDLRSKLKEKVLSCGTKKRPRWGDFEEFEALSSHGPSLKRAFLGKPPPSTGGKGGEGRSGRSGSGVRESAVASIASRRPSSGSRGSSANRARSLIRLARQLRGSDSDRRSGDLLLRQTLLNSSSTGLLVEDMEEDGDVLGFFSGADGVDVLPLDSSDSLSRLVASIQSRSRGQSGRVGDAEDGGAGEGGGGGGSGNSGGGKEKDEEQSPKKLSEECARLYRLMREAERECYEIRRRIDAWVRLQHDALLDLGSVKSEVPFTPTRCGTCAEPVTFHLLVLIIEMMRVDMADMEGSITKEFVRALFVDPSKVSKDLLDVKRLAINTLAVNSKTGAQLVLNELKARLRATNDKESAEILGKLLQSDFSLVDEYVSLAIETAASSI